MPRIKPLPDFSGVDLAELELEIMAMIERLGIPPELRRNVHLDFGGCLDRLGGAPAVLAIAIANIRRRFDALQSGGCSRFGRAM